MPDLAQPADWSGLLDGVSHVVHLAGIAHGPGSLPGALYSRINGEAVGELGAQARGKVERLVFISSVRAQVGVCGRARHHREGPGAAHRRLWAGQAAGREAARAERRPLHRAPPRRRLWQGRQRQYRGARHARQDADAAALRPPHQSPLSARARKSCVRGLARAHRRRRPRTRPFSWPMPSRSALPTSSRRCAKGLGAPLTSSPCRRAPSCG